MTKATNNDFPYSVFISLDNQKTVTKHYRNKEDATAFFKAIENGLDKQKTNFSACLSRKMVKLDCL